jgi:hypothetical protein
MGNVKGAGMSSHNGTQESLLGQQQVSMYTPKFDSFTIPIHKALLHDICILGFTKLMVSQCSIQAVAVQSL